MSILATSDGKGQGMREKLDMRQVFADAFDFLQTQMVGLMPLLLLAILMLSIAQYVTVTFISPVLGAGIFYVIELVTLSGVGAVAYRRALGLQMTKTWLAATLSLSLAQLLVELLFTIIASLLLAFLAMFAGILLSAGEAGLSDGFASADEFYALVSAISVPSQIILGLFVIVSSLALVWTSARLILFGVATLAYERLMIFRTWGWTAGHALRIMAFAAIFLSPVWLLYLLAEFAVPIEPPAPGESDLLRWRPGDTVVYVGMTFIYFLLGHAAAVAVFKQLAPDFEDHQTAFT